MHLLSSAVKNFSQRFRLPLAFHSCFPAQITFSNGAINSSFYRACKICIYAKSITQCDLIGGLGPRLQLIFEADPCDRWDYPAIVSGELRALS